jgi:flagellar assembly factor FliW
MANSNAAHQINDEEEYMEINTRYGKQLVAKSSLLTFPEGLPGFEGLHQYKLFHEEGKSTVYYLSRPKTPTSGCRWLRRSRARSTTVSS